MQFPSYKSIPHEQDQNPTNLLSHAIKYIDISVIAHPAYIMTSYDFIFTLLELFTRISTLQDSYLTHPRYLQPLPFQTARYCKSVELHQAPPS